MPNTNEPMETVEGQSLKTSTGMTPVVKWLVGIVILAGVGFGGWYLGQNQISKINNPMPTGRQENDNVKLKNTETPITQTPTTSSTSVINEPSTTTVPDPTADLPAKDSSTEGWKTYENKDYGFSFKYPGDWSIISKSSCEGLCQVTLKFIANNNDSNNTNSELSIIIKAANYDQVRDLPQYAEVIDNFSGKNVYHLEDAKLGNQVSGKKYDDGGGMIGVLHSYVTINNRFAYLLEFTPEDINSRLISKEKLQNNFDKILSTFKFTP